MADYFAYRHRVEPAEIGLGGSADHLNFLGWQERCRELFLGGLGADALADAQGELHLCTLQIECELFAEVFALDELSVRMRVAGTGHTELSLTFDHVRVTADGEETLVARGGQRVACLRGPESSAVPALIPDALARALAPHSAAGNRPLAGRQI